MKRIINASLAIIAALLLASCATAAAEEAPTKDYDTEFEFVTDWAAEEEPVGFAAIAQEQAERAAQAAPQEQAAQEPEPVYYEEAYYAPIYSSGYDGGGFKQEGVREQDGVTYTWYSSNAAYHHRTSEWEVDDEGFYRDSDGYYVVASEDYAEGDVVDTPWGEGKVYDGGCDSGVVDMYTAF